MKTSYGQPPFFMPALFLRVLVATAIVIVLAMIAITVLWQPIDLTDRIGTAVCTPLVAYLVHLWLAPAKAD